jgi:hypothetical protein
MQRPLAQLQKERPELARRLGRIQRAGYRFSASLSLGSAVSGFPVMAATQVKSLGRGLILQLAKPTGRRGTKLCQLGRVLTLVLGGIEAQGLAGLLLISGALDGCTLLVVRIQIGKEHQK